MSLLEIVTVGSENDHVLRKHARKVKTFDAQLGKLLDDMTETMLEAPGVGLAAPQINVSERIIIVRLPEDEESKEEYGEMAGVIFQCVNPEITKASDEKVEGIEACLSIPSYFGPVMRHEAITVQYQDRDGKKQRVKAEGWLARVFQHEIDHLDGILFPDLALELYQETDEDEVETEPVAAAEAETISES